MKFSVAVRLFLARILRQVKWWSVTMVSRYDAKSSTLSSHFCVKMHVFPTSFRNNVKLEDKMMQSNYLRVILHVKSKKLLIVTVLTWSLILDKIQDGGESLFYLPVWSIIYQKLCFGCPLDRHAYDISCWFYTKTWIIICPLFVLSILAFKTSWGNFSSSTRLFWRPPSYRFLWAI